jgi:hypothetical protein
MRWVALLVETWMFTECGEGCFDSRNLYHKVKLLDIYRSEDMKTES